MSERSEYHVTCECGKDVKLEETGHAKCPHCGREFFVDLTYFGKK